VKEPINKDSSKQKMKVSSKVKYGITVQKGEIEKKPKGDSFFVK
jgi:hypothetical protein